MFLYLVQHGEAKRQEEDLERRLTEKGVEDVRKVALYAKKTGLRLDQIVHSAKPRARETAKIFAEHLKPGKGIDQADNLLPMDDPSLWAMRLAGMNENIMLIGHLPYMAKLAGLLLCEDMGKTFIDFKMGGIVCLKRLDSRWAVEWMIVPEMVQ